MEDMEAFGGKLVFYSPYWHLWFALLYKCDSLFITIVEEMMDAIWFGA